MNPNNYLRYIKGEMKGKELEEWKKWEQDKIQRQREFDARYRTEHADDYKNKFYKLMEK